MQARVGSNVGPRRIGRQRPSRVAADETGQLGQGRRPRFEPGTARGVHSQAERLGRCGRRQWRAHQQVGGVKTNGDEPQLFEQRGDHTVHR